MTDAANQTSDLVLRLRAAKPCTRESHDLNSAAADELESLNRLAGDFEMMLRRLVHRLRDKPGLGLAADEMVKQAADLLHHKGRTPILRQEHTHD
jgi:hypothetical protein